MGRTRAEGRLEDSSPASPASGGDRVGIPPWLPTRRRGRGLCGPPASHSPAPPSFSAPTPNAAASPPDLLLRRQSRRPYTTGVSAARLTIESLTYATSTLASPIGCVVGEAWFSRPPRTA